MSSTIFAPDFASGRISCCATGAEAASSSPSRATLVTSPASFTVTCMMSFGRRCRGLAGGHDARLHPHLLIRPRQVHREGFRVEVAVRLIIDPHLRQSDAARRQDV